jgi:hypothetical protein
MPSLRMMRCLTPRTSSHQQAPEVHPEQPSPVQTVLQEQSPWTIAPDSTQKWSPGQSEDPDRLFARYSSPQSRPFQRPQGGEPILQAVYDEKESTTEVL